MAETYEEHMRQVLAAGGAHECASDCPPAMTEDRVPSPELEWECTPQKGLQARPCPNRRLPLSAMPGVPLPYQPHRRIGLHSYKPGRAHEAYFDLVEAGPR